MRVEAPWLDPRTIADAFLELTIVGSFSRQGFLARRRLFGWPPVSAQALAGRTALITGPTSGLGRATAEALAAIGARVILVGRNAERLGAVRDALIATHGEDRFPIVVADMGSLASVREAVDHILRTEPRLDVLVDNAGAIHPDRREGPDGIEAMLALLVVGPFVLVSGLCPLLRRTGDARVIAVTSGGMYTQRVDLDDLELRHTPYSGARAYARAKRMQVALVREWARRGARWGVAFDAMHPGWADTPGLAESLPGFYRTMRPLLRTPGQGVDTIAWLATRPTRSADTGADAGGRLYLDRRSRPFDRIPSTRLDGADRRRLWDEIVRLSGAPDPALEPVPAR